MIATVFIAFFNLFVLAMNALVLGRIIASWVMPASGVHRFLTELTEPVIAPVRRLMPDTGMLDLAPFVTILLLNLVQTLLNNLIF